MSVIAAFSMTGYKQNLCHLLRKAVNKTDSYSGPFKNVNILATQCQQYEESLQTQVLKVYLIFLNVSIRFSSVQK